MMTSQSPQEFSTQMSMFLSETRNLLRKHGALFDKFTGDGFIAYFNDAMCHRHGPSGRDESFVAFIREYLNFSIPFFREWVSTLKQGSNKPMGLAMGVDLGKVSFRNPGYHFVAVGEAIVLASRLADEACAEEIIVNNSLYETLCGISNLNFKKRDLNHRKELGTISAWSMCLLKA